MYIERVKKTPVMMSALVWPGVGQLMQGRLPAGAAFIVVTLLLCVSLLFFFVRIMAAFYRVGLEFADPGRLAAELGGFGGSFLGMLLVYAVNVFDVARFGCRQPPPLPD